MHGTEIGHGNIWIDLANYDENFRSYSRRVDIGFDNERKIVLITLPVGDVDGERRIAIEASATNVSDDADDFDERIVFAAQAELFANRILAGPDAIGGQRGDKGDRVAAVVIVEDAALLEGMASAAK